MASDKSKPSKSKSSNAKPIDDVSKPGSTPPSDTSVPIITSRPIMKDPMVLGQESVNEMEDEKVDLKIPTREAKKIEMKDSDTVAEIAVKAKAEKEQEEIEKAEAEAKAKAAGGDVESGGATNDIPIVQGGEKVIQPLKQNEESDESASSDNKKEDLESKDGDKEEQTDNSGTDKSKTDDSDLGDKKDAAKSPEKAELDAIAEEEAKKAEHEANVQKIIDSKKFELPITTEEKRRSTRMTILGVLLAIVLAGAWVDVALDAGLIQLTGVPHTSYFAKSSTPTNSAPLVKASFKTVDAKVAKVSFKVPSAWKVDELSSAEKDYISIDSNQKVGIKTYNTFFANFVSPREFTAPTKQYDYQVLYIKYTKLPHKMFTTVYLREMFYKSPTGNISGITDLASQNDIKAGDTIHNLNGGFLSPSGQNTSFTLTLMGLRDGKPGFGTLNSAKEFLTTSTYRKAKAMLLSTTASQQ